MTIKTRWLLLVGTVLLVPSLVIAEDCVLGEEYSQKGLEAGKQSKWTEAREWLSKSVANCNRFNNWYLLGQTLSELKELDDAASAFEDARRYATSDNEKALAIARYAEIQSKQGLVTQPLSLLHAARNMHSNPPKWITELTRNLDQKRVSQPLTVAQITGALNNRSIKLLNVQTKPSLNVSIHFEFDSTEVVDDSKDRIEVLGLALMDESLKDKKIRIVGHTDSRGPDQYNTQLSQNRAKHILEMLTKRYPELRNRVSVVGVGEQQPLYKGESEWEFQMNRRIEVQVDQ